MTTAAVANLRAALEGYRRGTKKHVRHHKGAHEMFGSLVAVMSGDVVTACEAVPAEKRSQVVTDLHAGSAKLPADTEVVLQADDVFELLDLVSAG